MKTSLSLLIVLALAASSRAAIEFSEDQVSAVEDAATTSAEDVAISPVTATDEAQMDAMVTVAQAQTSGAVGSAGSLNGMGPGMMGLIGGGGGGAAVSGAAGTGDGTGDGGGGGGGGGGGNNDGGGDPDQGDAGPSAVPEPTPVVVWSILAICGIAVIRVLRV